MLIKSTHETFLVFDDQAGRLSHLPLEELETASAVNVSHRLGKILYGPLSGFELKTSPDGGGLNFCRGGNYLCAEFGSAEVNCNRSAPNDWERFTFVDSSALLATRVIAGDVTRKDWATLANACGLGSVTDGSNGQGIAANSPPIFPPQYNVAHANILTLYIGSSGNLLVNVSAQSSDDHVTEHHVYEGTLLQIASFVKNIGDSIRLVKCDAPADLSALVEDFYASGLYRILRPNFAVVPADMHDLGRNAHLISREIETFIYVDGNLYLQFKARQ